MNGIVHLTRDAGPKPHISRLRREKPARALHRRAIVHVSTVILVTCQFCSDKCIVDNDMYINLLLNVDVNSDITRAARLVNLKNCQNPGILFLDPASFLHLHN